MTAYPYTPDTRNPLDSLDVVARHTREISEKNYDGGEMLSR
jgi:hypothetical protein